MQQTKDTFYMALRERLAAVNPERTVVVDGVVRPAIAVEENEAGRVEDAFRLTWGACSRVGGGSGLMKVDCTVRYATRGVDGTTGDRGRELARLDGELRVASEPPRAMKTDYGAIPAKSDGTVVFWTEFEFGAPQDEAGTIEREAKTTVYFFAPTSTAEVRG